MGKRRSRGMLLKCPHCGYYGHQPCYLTEWGRYWYCWKCDAVILKRYEEVKSMGMNKEIFEEIIKELYTDNIKIDPKKSEIWFKIQDGPINEVGYNGVQIDMIGKIWLRILQEFNKKFPCRENSLSITKIEEALHWQEARTKNRIDRKVEGYNKK